MPEPYAPERPSGDTRGRVHRDAARDDPVEGAGNEVLAGRHVLIARARERDIHVHRRPAVRIDVVGDLDAVAPAGRPGLGTARIPHVDEFGIEAEIPHGRCRLQPADGDSQ